MDGFVHLATNKEGWSIILGCLCTLAACGGVATLIVYYGIFAFANPDSAAWYGDVMGKPGLYESEQAAIEAQASNITNVHAKFRFWFLWGFIWTLFQCSFQIILLVSKPLIARSNPELA